MNQKTVILDAGDEISPTAPQTPEIPVKTETLPDGTFVIPLTTAIPVYDEVTKAITRVKVLKFRKPTGLDLIEVGNPVLFNPMADPPSIEHKTGLMLRMMERLSDIPMASLYKLEPTDMVSCFWALTPVFMPRADI